MVRIGGGVFPDIKERDYLNRGQYRVDSTAPKAMLDSTMYRWVQRETWGGRGAEATRVQTACPGRAVVLQPLACAAMPLTRGWQGNGRHGDACSSVGSLPNAHGRGAL